MQVNSHAAHERHKKREALEDELNSIEDVLRSLDHEKHASAIFLERPTTYFAQNKLRAAMILAAGISIIISNTLFSIFAKINAESNLISIVLILASFSIGILLSIYAVLFMRITLRAEELEYKWHQEKKTEDQISGKMIDLERRRNKVRFELKALGALADDRETSQS